MPTAAAELLYSAKAEISNGHCVIVYGSNGGRSSALMGAAASTADAACINEIAGIVKLWGISIAGTWGHDQTQAIWGLFRLSLSS